MEIMTIILTRSFTHSLISVVLILIVNRYESMALFDLQLCIEHFDMHRDKIIRTQDSQKMGARYLSEINLGSRQECLRLCCETDDCDVFIYEEKNSGSCYLFECGPPGDFKCKFTHHVNYTSGILTVHRQQNNVVLDLEAQIQNRKHEYDLANLRVGQNGDLHRITDANGVVRNSKGSSLQQQQQQQQQQEMDPDSMGKCSRYQFECRSNGECIAIYNACDGIAQCSDGSDEALELDCPTRDNSRQQLQLQSGFHRNRGQDHPHERFNQHSPRRNYFVPPTNQISSLPEDDYNNPESLNRGAGHNPNYYYPMNNHNFLVNEHQPELPPDWVPDTPKKYVQINDEPRIESTTTTKLSTEKSSSAALTTTTTTTTTTTPMTTTRSTTTSTTTSRTTTAPTKTSPLENVVPLVTIKSTTTSQSQTADHHENKLAEELKGALTRIVNTYQQDGTKMVAQKAPNDDMIISKPVTVPSGAIISLALGVLFTSLTAFFLITKVRWRKHMQQRRGRRPHGRTDGDYLVNGMYL